MPYGSFVTTRYVPQKNSPKVIYKSFTNQASSVKWLVIGLVLFLQVWPWFHLRPETYKERTRLLLTSHTFSIIFIYFFAHGWLLVEIFIPTVILSRLSTVVWSLLHQLLWLNKRVLWPTRWIWWLKHGYCKCRKFYLHQVNLYGCIKFAVSTSSDLREHPTPCNCYVAGMFKTRNDKMTKMSLRLA